jgi:DNA polymerase (family 10)
VFNQLRSSALSSIYESLPTLGLKPHQEIAKMALVRQCDVKGVLHSHTHYGDGAHSLGAMVATAREIGLEYLGISDHFLSPSRANGLNAAMIDQQRGEIEVLKREFPDFDILQGVEVDAGPDGSLPLDEAVLAQFDYVIVSLADGHDPDPQRQTDCILEAIRNRHTKILSKPVGNYMLKKAPVPMDLEAILQAAARASVTVEIDANPVSMELDWCFCHRAQELGVLLSINPNAHRAARLVDYRHGVELARSAGIACRSILNTMTCAELRSYFKRQR